ncbi:hypothetical protein [Pseudomonas sp. EL_65y_Pfl2_R96]|uniref:hypothetical protein n=1 Tax=Pseudomonas sp. EL_65y_Pfl2_R96 TaxID=3088699 RepID=UPI0030D75209
MTPMPLKQYRDIANGPLAKPLSVEGVDDTDQEGHISREILRNGTRIVIPYWSEPEDDDELWVMLRQNGVVNRLYTVFYPKPLSASFLYFDLTSQHLATDGIAWVYYKVWKGSGGNDDPSPERQLTIDHTPLLTLEEPMFPHATPWGYLNNNTKPPLTSGATVAMPASTNVALPGDLAKVYWQGYPSLNGSGVPVPETYGVWDRLLSEQDIKNGYALVVPFEPHIRTLFDNDSAVVTCQLFRAKRLIAESKKGLVKVDRVIPGESGPSGLNEGDREMTAQEKLPRKVRANPPRIGEEWIGIQATSVSVDKLADESIAISVLDSGEMTFKLARFTEEDDLDEVDVYFAKTGDAMALLKGFIPLGPIAGRDPVAMEIKVPTDEFKELSQPATPTGYQVQLVVYKGSAGNDDPSNIVTFNIDRTAPFEVKYPTRKKNPPTPAPTFVNAPVDAQRLVNENWIKDPANADLKFTVFVGYPLRRLDDELRVFLTSGSVKLEVFNGTVNAAGEFTVPNTVLRDLPNGRVTISYNWTDLPGNFSENSVPAAVLTLGLALDPKLNKGPLVPKTDPNRTTPIYLDDMVANDVFAIVERASIDNAEPGDQITVYAEDPNDVTNFVDFGTQPLASVDLSFQLTYKDKLEKIFDSSTETKEIKLWFELTRGEEMFSSPDTYIWLAFDHAGGVNPALPDLTNPDAVLPVVTGASKTPNELLPGDRDQSGEFKVTLKLTDPAITSAETAKCYLNNQFVGEFSPFVDAVEFSVPISADIISKLPTPMVPAYWTIQKTGVDKNVIKSLPETVKVNGKKIDLLPPTIRIRNPAVKNQIDCYAMNNATTNWRLAVTIPKDPVNLPQGKIIMVHFAAYSDAAGNNLISGTEDSQPYTIQAAGTVDVASVASAAVFKAAQPRLGTRAFGKYWYTADIGGLQTSVPIIKPLDTITSSGEYCDRLAAPPATP